MPPLRPASVHAVDDDSSESLAERSDLEVGERRAPKTLARRSLTPSVVLARRSASRLVGLAVLGCGGASAVARRLGVSHTQVNRWADEEQDDNIGLADILADGGSFARTVLTASLARQDEDIPASMVAPCRHVARLAHLTGEVAAAVDDMEADGIRTRDEKRNVAKHLAALQMQVARALRDLEVGDEQH